MQNLQSALGVAAIVAIAWLVSENRRAVPWRQVITGPAVTFAALLMLKVPQTQAAFNEINRAVEATDATRAGTSFVFGYVGGGPLPSIRNRRAAISYWPFRRCRPFW